jgi:hypothetical protein
MRDQLLISGATQRPIGLENKVLAREATSFPGQAYLRGSIARGAACGGGGEMAGANSVVRTGSG